MKKSEKPPLERLVEQARMTNALLAALLGQHMTQQAVIGLLRSVGARSQDIADILGTSYATVAVSLARLQKKRLNEKDSDNGESTQGAEADTPEADLREGGEGHE